MPNLHPPLSGIPFALLSLALLLELLCMWREYSGLKTVARVNLRAAAIISIATFFSGYFEADSASVSFSVPEDALATHFVYGRASMCILLLTVAAEYLAARATHYPMLFRLLYYSVLLASMALLSWTGWLGGELVFTHGAGVTAPIPPGT